MIEMTDKAYHLIVDHRNRDAELQLHDNEPEVTAQDDGSHYQEQAVMKPARFREWHCTVRCGPIFPFKEDEVTNDKQIWLMTSDMSVS